MEKTRMNKTDEGMLRQAFVEAFVRKYEGILSECGETAACSEAHTRRMQEIIIQSEQRARRKDRRKWIAALLVAAALLLSACSVYAYRDEIRRFIVQVYDECIKVSFNSGEKTPQAGISFEHCSVSYVPDGYVLTKERCLQIVTTYIWTNAEGDYIKFEQYLIDHSYFSVDNQTGETTLVQCGEYTVYCRSGGDVNTYIWNDGKYAFIITSSTALSEEDLTRLIESVVIAE